MSEFKIITGRWAKQRSFLQDLFDFGIFDFMSQYFFHRLNSLVLLFFLLLISACSKDDPQPENPIPKISLNTFLSSDSEEIQMDVTNEGSPPIITNLNEELGLDFLLFGRRDVDQNAVGFYFWQQQESRAYYKNLESGVSYEINDICGFRGETETPKVIRSVDGNENYVLMPYTFQSEGMSLEFGLRIFDREFSQCRDVFFPEIVPAGVENFSLAGKWFGLYYRDPGSGNPFLWIVDLSIGEVTDTINLNSDFQGATFRGNELWIFNEDASYLIFNVETGTFIQSGTAPGLPAQGPGMFDSRFSGNQLLVRFIYQQPSLFFAQPAVYDFDSGILVEGAEPFLPELQARIEQETGDRILFGNYGVDLPTGIIAISYLRGNGSAEGGVVLTNFELDWFEILELPLLPEEIEIRAVE